MVQANPSLNLPMTLDEQHTADKLVPEFKHAISGLTNSKRVAVWDYIRFLQSMIDAREAQRDLVADALVEAQEAR